MYKNEFRDAKETKKILENGSPDIFFKVYHKIKKRAIHHSGDKSMKKSRMDRLEESIDKLTKKIDNLGNDLRNEMDTGFKQVNARIDHLESRIDGIDARLDYNGLKKLPESR